MKFGGAFLNKIFSRTKRSPEAKSRQPDDQRPLGKVSSQISISNPINVEHSADENTDTKGASSNSNSANIDQQNAIDAEHNQVKGDAISDNLEQGKTKPLNPLMVGTIASSSIRSPLSVNHETLNTDDQTIENQKSEHEATNSAPPLTSTVLHEVKLSKQAPSIEDDNAQVAMLSNAIEECTSDESENPESIDRSDFSTPPTDLVEYVVSHKPSVRLSNALKAASIYGKLPATTVEEYLALSEPQKQSFLQIRNMGGKSFIELERIMAGAKTYLLCDNVPKKTKLDQYESGNIALKTLNEAFEQIDFLSILKILPISPRLKTLVGNLNAKLDLDDPTRSLGYILANGIAFKAEVLREGNIGSKTLQELLKQVDEVTRAIVVLLNDNDNDNDDLAGQLIHALRSQNPRMLDGEKFETVTSHVLNTIADGRLDYLEVARAIVIDFDALSEIRSQPKATIDRLLGHTLTDRELEIIEYRYGINARPRSTLEAISKLYSVTRERIRQIEAKAIRKLRLPVYRSVFKAHIEARMPEIWNSLDLSGELVLESMIAGWRGKLSGRMLLSIDVVYEGIEHLLDATSDVSVLPSEQKVWISKHIPIEKHDEIIEEILERNTAEHSLAQNIRLAILDGGWPIRMDDIQSRIPHSSKDAISEELAHKFGAEISGNGIVNTIKLPTSTRLILVLKDAGRALQLPEIEAKHNAMFFEEMSVHTISATLQRLDEALIVERGTYNLYENLSLGDEELISIKNEVERALKTRNSFISAKVLFREILSHLCIEIAPQINPYTILGICQDDTRFDCRRGLMIGLHDKEFQGEFEQLDDTIEQIVRDKGPISVSDIQELISETRDVLDTSIWFSLTKNEEIVAAGRGVFNLIERVLGNESTISNMMSAIQIALLPGETSFPVLLLRLESVNFTPTLSTLASFLQNNSYIHRNDSMLSLADTDTQIVEYDRKFQEIVTKNGGDFPQHDVFEAAFHSKNERLMMSLDFRLKLPREEWDSEHIINKQDTDLIADILMEFE